MLNFLTRIDHGIFHFINDTLGNSFFDAVMPVFTDLHKLQWFTYIVAPIALAFYIWKFRMKAVKVIFGLIISVACADHICVEWIKPTFQRARPPNAGIELNLRTDRYSGWSMPSSHATNNFAAATFISHFHPAATLVVFTIASLVCFSRIYVGVHFPFDVLVGALVGSLVAYLVAKAFDKIASYRKKSYAEPDPNVKR
jgi:undecaprenyl-diphosphatase